MSENKVYMARPYRHEVPYENLNGVQKTATLHFLIHPVELLGIFADYTPKKIKSGNPALNGKPAEMSDADQIKIIQQLAAQAAGTPSEDGENFDRFNDFETSVVGQAFMTMMVTSTKARRDFSEMAILNPFRAFVQFARQDDSNSPKEVADLERTLKQMEDIFKSPDVKDESAEEKRARLMAELGRLDNNAEGSQN